MRLTRALQASACGVWLVGAALAQDMPASPEAIYERQTQFYTTAALSTAELHALGRGELDRIAAELRGVMDEVGFDGTVEDFVGYLRTDEQFYYPDTDAGRAAYLATAAHAAAALVEEHFAEVIDLPRSLTPLKVGVIPDEVGPGVAAMYQPPRTEGAPGTVLFNLADMRSAPKFQVSAIVYHEAAGHHLQFAADHDRILAGGPTYNVLSAFSEGWGHYAERLTWELGLYPDPYSNAGRLGLEAWRAARLLADIGLAVDGWTRDEAIAFMLANTPLSERHAALEIDRCIDMPGTTSTYIIGKRTIMELRARAKAALGAEFDLRAFHQELLRRDKLPLPELEDAIEGWIAAQAG